eukprot:TRINITY_DN33054_c0_g1_i1.p2 TRINITY_DN33054_c0_g1~~TRINITY_DN33054_c0_g1_i1.p2  ORF type:complete len:139 (-),score=21.57 TRINITY_DN33054_c0_g1_i1:248-664(-)
MSLLNMTPSFFKSQIMTFSAGNLRANHNIFKVTGGSNLPYVLFEEEGAVGKYNRANRSLTHVTETGLGMLLAIPFAGYVFPYATVNLVVLYGLGRFFHMIGYSIAYGKHALGFAMSVLANSTLEMLVLVAGIKALERV